MLSLCHYVNSYSPEGGYEHDYFLSALADLLYLNFFTLKQCILEKFQMAISPQPVVRSTPYLVLGWVFRGRWI